jgi:hypothetical protein
MRYQFYLHEKLSVSAAKEAAEIDCLNGTDREILVRADLLQTIGFDRSDRQV